MLSFYNVWLILVTLNTKINLGFIWQHSNYSYRQTTLHKAIKFASFQITARKVKLEQITVGPYYQGSWNFGSVAGTQDLAPNPQVVFPQNKAIKNYLKHPLKYALNCRIIRFNLWNNPSDIVFPLVNWPDRKRLLKIVCTCNTNPACFEYFKTTQEGRCRFDNSIGKIKSNFSNSPGIEIGKASSLQKIIDRGVTPARESREWRRGPPLGSHLHSSPSQAAAGSKHARRRKRGATPELNRVSGDRRRLHGSGNSELRRPRGAADSGTLASFLNTNWAVNLLPFGDN